jgi:hypothetical protein
MRKLLASGMLDLASAKELRALLACEIVLRQAVREKVGTRKHDPATFLLAAAALGALDKASQSPLERPGVRSGGGSNGSRRAVSKGDR